MVFKLKQKEKCMKRPLIGNSEWIAAIYCQLETLRWTKGKSLHSETKKNYLQIFPSLLNLKRKQTGSWVHKNMLFYHCRTFLAFYTHDFILMLIGLPILNEELSLFRDFLWHLSHCWAEDPVCSLTRAAGATSARAFSHLPGFSTRWNSLQQERQMFLLWEESSQGTPTLKKMVQRALNWNNLVPTGCLQS